MTLDIGKLHASRSGQLQKAVRNRLFMEMMEMLEEELHNHLWDHLNQNGNMTELLEKLVNRQVDPYTEARNLVRRLLAQKNH